MDGYILESFDIVLESAILGSFKGIIGQLVTMLAETMFFAATAHLAFLSKSKTTKLPFESSLVYE
jgi:hypothetical protein